MWVWLLFSAGSFLLVRFVDGSGCLALSAWSAFAGLVRYLVVATESRRLDAEAVAHLEYAQSISATSEGDGMLAVANLAGMVSDVALQNAESVDGLVVGGAAKVAQLYLHGQLGGPEAVAHRQTAAAKTSDAGDLRGSALLVIVGVLLMSAIAVGLGATGVMPTPAREQAAIESVRQERESAARTQAANAQTARVRSTCAELERRLSDFIASSTSSTPVERRAKFLAVANQIVLFDREYAAAALNMSPVVMQAIATAADAIRETSGDAGPPSRREAVLVDRKLRALGRTLSAELHAHRPLVVCPAP